MTDPTANHAADLATRWVPSPAQMAEAGRILAAEPGAYAVVVAIALPGKEHGWWEAGQVVEHVPGRWVAYDRKGSPPSA